MNEQNSIQAIREQIERMRGDVIPVGEIIKTSIVIATCPADLDYIEYHLGKISEVPARPDKDQIDLLERVSNLVHAVKFGNFGMEWTRWNSKNQAERIITLVHADERKRMAAELLSDEAISAMFTEDTRYPMQPTNGDISETRRTMALALAAIGIITEEVSDEQ